MASLTVNQPKVSVLKVEIHNGLNIDRRSNLQKKEYDIKKSSLMGAPASFYIPTSFSAPRSCLDHLDSNHKPYLVAVTLMIESPMKLYVEN